MLRTLVLIFASVCVAVVLSEGAVGFLLWQRGTLSEHNLREIRLLLSGEVTLDPAISAPEAEKRDAPQVSYESVQTARALRILELQGREANLAALHKQILEEQKRIQGQQDAFVGEQKAFEAKLQELTQQFADSGTEQARGVLLALPPAQAADKLMALELEDSLRLFKGMPEKSAAKILKELSGSADKLKRGQELFRAIYQGDPQRALADQAKSRLKPPADEKP